MFQGSKVAVLGMVIQPLIGNPYNGYINPYYWVDEFIPYYMEIMGVDRPDRTYVSRDKKKTSISLASCLFCLILGLKHLKKLKFLNNMSFFQASAW